MRSAILTFLFGVLLLGCEQKSVDPAISPFVEEKQEAVRPMIRSIRFFGTEEDFGIELNGDRAFLRQESVQPNRIEISYERGLKLLEDFYAIPDIEDYRGKDSDDRQTSIHYLVHIFDEMPQHYSEEWVDYVFLKNEVGSIPAVKTWFDEMESTKRLANAEQVADDQLPARAESEAK